ncbi:MAG: hypothetical protein DRZ82_10030 [Thermoprotei archaeon]|nr:MAG: hypothetical protein DRZ82_10030 [Thermoprotei archaeon]
MHVARRKGILVVFLGPVGVGKSTIIGLLTHVLNTLGIKVRRIFLKASHGLSYLLWSSAAKLLALPEGHAPWYVIPKCGYISLARTLTLVSAYLDAFVNMPTRILISKLYRFTGFVVLCEEYLYTALYDYLYSYAALNVRLRTLTLLPLLVMHVLASAHKPNMVVLLDANDRELLRRWRMRGYGDPQPRYVKLQREFLKKIPYSKVLYIETSNRSIHEVVKLVLKAVVELLREEDVESEMWLCNEDRY